MRVSFYLILIMKKFLAITIFATAILQPLFAQVTISGRIIDADSKRDLSSVSIIYPKNGVTYISAHDGTFSFSAEKQDTFFLFLPGYQTIRFSVSDSIAKERYALFFTMEPLYAESKPVIIRPKKGLDKIEEDRKKLGETPRELDPPKIEPFTSPISAIYDLLSDDTRQKKKLRTQIIEDNRRKLFYSLFDFYRENKVVDIPEEYYDNFIDFMNLPIEFLKYNTDYEITKTVVEQYKRYARFSGIQK